MGKAVADVLVTDVSKARTIFCSVKRSVVEGKTSAKISRRISRGSRNKGADILARDLAVTGMEIVLSFLDILSVLWLCV